MLKSLGIGGGIVLTTTGVGWADDESGQGDGRTAEVRVGHLSPDAPAVDIYVGKEPDGEPTIGGLEYPNVAPGSDGEYLGIEAGEYDITVTPAGTTSPQVIDVDDIPLEPNRDYTILAVGELSPEGDEPSIQPLPLVDNADGDTTLPPADATLVRLVHASPDAGEVDLVVKQDGKTLKTIPGVSFGDATGYLELPPGDYTIDVGPGALGVEVTLKAGTKITGYVIGNATPEDGDESLSAITT
ncbi:MAG: DUF4397 domain-containing protein, partial [Halobacteriales archaeon]